MPRKEGPAKKTLMEIHWNKGKPRNQESKKTLRKCHGKQRETTFILCVFFQRVSGVRSQVLLASLVTLVCTKQIENKVIKPIIIITIIIITTV